MSGWGQDEKAQSEQILFALHPKADGRADIPDRQLCARKRRSTGPQGRTLGESVRSPLSGVKPPGSGQAPPSAHDQTSILATTLIHQYLLVTAR
jgi:hypothetical protein